MRSSNKGEPYQQNQNDDARSYQNVVGRGQAAGFWMLNCYSYGTQSEKDKLNRFIGMANYNAILYLQAAYEIKYLCHLDQVFPLLHPLFLQPG